MRATRMRDGPRSHPKLAVALGMPPGRYRHHKIAGFGPRRLPAAARVLARSVGNAGGRRRKPSRPTCRARASSYDLRRKDGLRFQQFHVLVKPSWRYPVPPTGSPLRCLNNSIPPIAFSRHFEPISTPNWRDRIAPARHAKAAERPHACAPPSIAGQVPLGKTWTNPARPQSMVIVTSQA